MYFKAKISMESSIRAGGKSRFLGQKVELKVEYLTKTFQQKVDFSRKIRLFFTSI